MEFFQSSCVIKQEIEFPVIPNDTNNIKYKKTDPIPHIIFYLWLIVESLFCSSCIPNPEHSAWDIVGVH